MGNPGIPPEQIIHGVNWRICKAGDGKRCPVCKKAAAKYQREYRASKAGKAIRPPSPPPDHGSRARYRTCTDGPDDGPCAACRKANSDYANQNNKDRRLRDRFGPDPLADYFKERDGR